MLSCSVIYTHMLHFIHSSFNEHLGCFHVWAIVISAAMNTGKSSDSWFEILNSQTFRGLFYNWENNLKCLLLQSFFLGKCHGFDYACTDLSDRCHDLETERQGWVYWLRNACWGRYTKLMHCGHHKGEFSLRDRHFLPRKLYLNVLHVYTIYEWGTLSNLLKY